MSERYLERFTEFLEFLLKAFGIVFLFVILLIVGILWGLSMLFNQYEGPPLIPMPDIPAELTTLPAQAQIKCSHDASLNQGILYVWEYPGIYPADPDLDSLYMGDRGRRLGSVRYCIEVQVVDYSWSEIDGEFWVRIIPEQAASGWISFSAVDFTYDSNSVMPSLPPKELRALPAQAQIACSHDANLNRGSFYVWDAPGIYPVDNDLDSAHIEDGAEIFGEVRYCTEVQIIHYAWSKTHRDFWVQIVTEQVAGRGWISFSVLDFDFTHDNTR